MALIRPFVPSLNFPTSCPFYEALGFVRGYRDESIAIFELEGASFLLQNFYVKELADNFMVQLFVADLDAWWPRTAAVAERFGTPAPRAPTLSPGVFASDFWSIPQGSCGTSPNPRTTDRRRAREKDQP